MKPVDADGLIPAGVRALPVVAWQQGATQRHTDWVAEEVPVALVFNGLSHAVMMATPADLDDFALGFGLTEGLLAHPAELYGVEAQPTEAGIELQLEVSSACFDRLKTRRRTLAGRTGCGLCGTDSLAQVRQVLPTVPPTVMAPQALARAMRDLRAGQAVQRLTGASHAAAWCNASGEIVCVREDVGRHNALDKLIGALLRAGVSRHDGAACITSRASFEMVQKAALAGMGVLAAVSAPTALAIETAQACGMALAGFVRGDDGVAYTQAARLGWPDAANDIGASTL